MPELSIIKGEEEPLVTRPLHQIFEDNLLKYPQETALIYQNDCNNSDGINKENINHSIPSTMTYNQMNALVNRYARYIISLSKRNKLQANSDGDILVGICMQPSDRLVTILMAIWKAGAAYLPIDASFPVTRIRHILSESHPIMIVHDGSLDEQCFGSSVLSVNAEKIIEESQQFSEANLRSEEILKSKSNLAIVLYTSGSTGVPKGVRLTHDVILNRLKWQWSTFPYTACEKVGVFKTALTFVDSVAELWGPLLNGLSILIVPKAITKDPERLVNLLEEYSIRRLVLVPTLLRSLLMYLNFIKKHNIKEKQRKRLYNLQMWVCSGEPLSINIAKNFFDYFDEKVHSLYNFYGSTEVMGDVTYFSCGNMKLLNTLQRVPIGLPISNTVIYLLDSDYKPVKQGEIGELFVSGLNLASGYVNNRDSEKFIENPFAEDLKYSRLYRTGDYGCFSNGLIFYEGRTDSQIKVRGHRVDLSEVEKVVLDLAEVDKVTVLCYHAGQIDQALLAFVKLKDDSPLINEMHLETKLKNKLADYMMPQLILIDTVPLLVNGKVDRQSLLKLYETANNNEGDTSIVLDYDYSQIPNDLKSIAQDLFETVGNAIGRSTRAALSIESNFYELGGNSLNSIFTVTKLREKGYNIGITEFIAAKNLGEILQSIIKNANGEINIMDDIEGWHKTCPHLDMIAIPLRNQHKSQVIQIIIDSFYGKADLEQWLKPDILPTDYSDLLELIWSDLVEKDLSFVTYDRASERIIGASLNFDIHNEPEVEVKSKLVIVFEFLEHVEGPLRDGYLPQGLNKVLHSFMMGTHAELNAQENIACMQFMENEVLNVAKSKGFIGILTTNTSPLTQQLGTDIYHYETLLDYQVNKFILSDGSLPFAKAPDSQKVIVHWRKVTTT